MTLAALIERIDAEWEKRDFCNELPDYVGISEDEWGAIRDALPVWRPIESAPLDSRKIAVWDAEKSSIHTIRADDLKQRRVFHWLQSFTHWMPILPPEDA